MARNEPSPEVNGQAVKKPRKTRPKKGESQILATANKCDSEKPEEENCGRTAASIKTDDVAYLVFPWIPFRELTLVAGQPQTGKSSFASWIAAQAGRSAYLPGYEENIGTATLPRLSRNGVSLSDVLIFDDREYRLPRDKTRIANALKRWKARVLIIDPIDSYLEDGKSENASADVREMLEAAHWVGEKADAAVVGIRHPGKDVKNIMPGSRAWRAVPRSVVFLAMDASFPPKRYLIHDKDSHGNDVPPKRYGLEGKPGQPRKFILGESVDAEVARFSREVSEPTQRQGVRMAGRILRRNMTKETDATVEDFKNECKANDVNERSRHDAMRLLGVEPKAKEGGGKWYLFRASKEWPAWTDEEKK